LVLDAFALVALVADEPAASEVDGLLRRGDAAVTAVNLAEAVDVLGRTRGHEPETVRDVLAPLVAETLTLAELDEDMAYAAGALRKRHYDRKTSPLSLADCFALAAAVRDGALATADPPLAAAAREEAVDVMALPDSRGRRP
jgi:PIN domain nuclease of toxin-antitoxin system